MFSGGSVDITYCDISGSAEGGEIDQIRIDASPREDIDVDQYLDEEFVDPDEVTVSDIDGFAGGAARQGCWDDDRACGVFWQGDELFMGIVAFAEDPIDPADSVAMAEALVPAAVTNLADAA